MKKGRLKTSDSLELKNTINKIYYRRTKKIKLRKSCKTQEKDKEKMKERIKDIKDQFGNSTNESPIKREQKNRGNKIK